MKITKEIYIGSINRLADLIENPMKDIRVLSLDFGSTAFVLMIDQKIGLKNIVDNIMEHKGKGMSPGDYMLLFIMNCLSDPGSKSAIEKQYTRIILRYHYKHQGFIINKEKRSHVQGRCTDSKMGSLNGCGYRYVIQQTNKGIL